MDCKLIKQKILTGDIKSWADVYGYTTPQEMSERLGRGVKYWESVKYNPMKMYLGSAFKFIEEVGITKKQFDQLVNGMD